MNWVQKIVQQLDLDIGARLPKPPRSIRAAGLIALGAVETAGGLTGDESPEERRDEALKLIIAGLYMWYFWGTPSKELKKYETSHRNSSSARLRDKGLET
jgi:hypothetical protein